MSTRSHFAVLSVSLVVLGLSGMTMGQPHDNAPKNKEGAGSLMTKQEAARLRAIIYDGSLCTRMNLETPLPQREVALNNEVVDLHKKKRVAVLRLLLDVARGGRPKDALAAGVTALALEEGPAYAVLWIDRGLDAFDNAQSNEVSTERERLVEQVEKALVKAEKQVKADGKK